MNARLLSFAAAICLVLLAATAVLCALSYTNGDSVLAEVGTPKLGSLQVISGYGLAGVGWRRFATPQGEALSHRPLPNGLFADGAAPLGWTRYAPRTTLN